jgi:hypothetical protein
VRHDDDGERALQLADEVLDGEGRDRVQRRAGLVHEQDLGLHRDGAGDAQPLLLAAGQTGTGLVEAVLDLVPQVRPAQGLLDGLGEDLLVPHAVEAHPGRDVVEDRHRRERVGALEDHADGPADVHRVHLGGVEVVVVEHDAALDAAAGDDLVHAVQRPQEGRLAAAGRADEGRHGTGFHRHGHVLDGLEAAVVDVEVLDVDALGHGISLTS